MKTVIAFLLTLLFIALAGFFTSLTIETLLDSNQTYIGQQTNDVYHFRVVLLVSAFLLTILAIGCIITASITAAIFYNNYLRILQRRRDNDIKRDLLNAKYDKLYEELSNTNIYEEKEKIVKAFYRDTQIRGIKQMMNDLMKDIKTKHKDPNGDSHFDSPITN